MGKWVWVVVGCGCGSGPEGALLNGPTAPAARTTGPYVVEAPDARIHDSGLPRGEWCASVDERSAGRDALAHAEAIHVGWTATDVTDHMGPPDVSSRRAMTFRCDLSPSGEQLGVEVRFVGPRVVDVVSACECDVCQQCWD